MTYGTGLRSDFVAIAPGIDGLNNGFVLPPMNFGTNSKVFTASQPNIPKNGLQIYRDLSIVAYQSCDWNTGFPGNGQFNSPDTFASDISTWATQRSDIYDSVSSLKKRADGM